MRQVGEVSIAKSSEIETNGLQLCARHVRLVGIFAITLLLGGCGHDSSLFGTISDSMMPLTTGSIVKSSTPLSGELTPHDWSIANPALTAALESDIGERIKWTDREARRSGDFMAIGGLSVYNDILCRSFEARLVADGTATLKIRGIACRGVAGTWRVIEDHSATL
ncbi:MAG: hypothetical protein ACKOC1_08000 [Hyphomicrobiales bacterium]